MVRRGPTHFGFGSLPVPLLRETKPLKRAVGKLRNLIKIGSPTANGLLVGVGDHPLINAARLAIGIINSDLGSLEDGIPGLRKPELWSIGIAEISPRSAVVSVVTSAGNATGV